MMDSKAQPATPGCRCQPGKILREAVLVGAIGVGFAFLANQLSPRGLNPFMNYSPGGARASALPRPAIVPSEPPGATNASSPAALLAARLKENGLRLLQRAEVEKLFHDPRLQQDAIMFIDARDEDDYGKGHIPGAFEFYHYHPGKYLAGVLTPCQLAEQIIVYCNGGDCDDSESARQSHCFRGVGGREICPAHRHTWAGGGGR